MEQFGSIRTQFGDHILWIEMREPYKGKMASGSNVLALPGPDSSLDKRETDRETEVACGTQNISSATLRPR